MANHWKKIIVSLSVVSSFVMAGQLLAAEEWEKVAKRINTDQAQAAEDAAETERLIKMDKAAQQKELAELTAKAKNEEKRLDQFKAELDRLRKVEAKLEKDLEKEQDEIDAIEGTVRATARDALTLSRDNPITAEYPDRGEVLDELVKSKKFPGLPHIETLVEFFFQEMSETGKILRRTGEFIGPDGRMTSGDIIRIGGFTTYYRLANGSVGFLMPEEDGKTLRAVVGSVSRSMRKKINNFFDGKGKIAPMDFSKGASFVKLERPITFREWLDSGGFIMYIILAVGIFAVLLGLERILMLGTKAKASDEVMGQINELVKRSKWKEARDYCSTKSRIPTCQMLDSVIGHVGQTQEVLENALQEAILKQIPRLERFIPTLALLAVISPLLGLLGTVTGMIETFKVIMQAGTEAKLMAGGISVALLTTQFGLIVAVPIMLLHHFLKSQVEKIVSDMQEKGMAFAVTLVKQSSSKEA